MHTAISPMEDHILRQILLKVPESRPWLSSIRFVYANKKMDIVLNEIPETMARKIMHVFGK